VVRLRLILMQSFKNYVQPLSTFEVYCNIQNFVIFAVIFFRWNFETNRDLLLTIRKRKMLISNYSIVYCPKLKISIIYCVKYFKWNTLTYFLCSCSVRQWHAIVSISSPKLRPCFQKSLSCLIYFVKDYHGQVLPRNMNCHFCQMTHVLRRLNRLSSSSGRRKIRTNDIHFEMISAFL
jgi:hypothetical protein